MKRYCWARTAISRAACPAPPTHDVTAGCVHEHLFEAWACDEHVAALAAGKIHCAHCYRAEDWHACPLLGRATPIEVPA